MNEVVLNIYPLIIVLSIILISILMTVITYLFFIDKKDNREHNLHILVENNRNDIIKKYTGDNGELDQERMLMDLAIQNQMIIDSLEKVKKLI